MIPPKPKKAAMLVFDPDAKKKKKVMVRKRKPRKLLEVVLTALNIIVAPVEYSASIQSLTGVDVSLGKLKLLRVANEMAKQEKNEEERRQQQQQQQQQQLEEQEDHTTTQHTGKMAVVASSSEEEEEEMTAAAACHRYVAEWRSTHYFDLTADAHLEEEPVLLNTLGRE
jgi:hypothetical protein